MLGYFKKMFGFSEPEKRNLTMNDLFEQFGGQSVKVDENKVMQIPTFQSAVNLITSTVAQMPIYLYQEMPDGTIEKINDDYRMKLLNHEPNETLNGYNFKQIISQDYLLHGKFVVVKHEAGNKILELHPLPPENVVSNKKIQNGYRTIGAEIIFTPTASENSIETAKPTTFKSFELMIGLQQSRNGLDAKGILHHGKDILEQCLNDMKIAKKFYERGAMPLGFLKVPEGMNPDDLEAYRLAWAQLYGGSNNAYKTLILQEGMDFKDISPKELSDKMAQKYATDIARMFNLPEGMLAGQNNSKYQSLEQNQKHYLLNTLQSILTSIEAAADKSLLLEKEKAKGYFFRFDTSELIRGTEKERIEALGLGVEKGLFTINEARSKLDLSPADGWNVLLLTSGMQAMDEKGNLKSYDKSSEPITKKEEPLNDETNNGTEES